MTKPSLYGSYSDVPHYRRHWFFWLFFFIVPPIALALLLTGDVYYPSKGAIASFGIFDRIVLGLFLVFVLYRLYREFVAT